MPRIFFPLISLHVTHLEFRKSEGSANLFTIRDYNIVNIFICSVICELFQVMLDSICVMDVEKAALWFPEQTGIVLNRIAFCWSINHAKHFFEMVAYKLDHRNQYIVDAP